jgi:hypothetical protein
MNSEAFGKSSRVLLAWRIEERRRAEYVNADGSGDPQVLLVPEANKDVLLIVLLLGPRVKFAQNHSRNSQEH